MFFYRIRAGRLFQKGAGKGILDPVTNTCGEAFSENPENSVGSLTKILVKLGNSRIL